MSESFVCVNPQRISWCGYHNAEIVNPRDGLCWDAERMHPCVVVERGLVDLSECIPATVETHNEHKNGPPRGCCQRFVSAWQPVKVEQ